MSSISTERRRRHEAIMELWAIQRDLTLKLESGTVKGYARTNIRQLLRYCASRTAAHQKRLRKLDSQLTNRQQIG